MSDAANMHVPKFVAVIAVLICLNTVYGKISKQAESKQLSQDTDEVKVVEESIKKEADKVVKKEEE